MKKCVECNEYMFHSQEFGDGYYEPRVTQYICKCGVECWDNEAHGEKWYDKKGEEIKS